MYEDILHIEPDIMLPTQYYGGVVSGHHLNPEHKLLMAILTDAINCYLGKKDHERAMAHLWFRSPRQHFMSFLNICRFLDINPKNLLAKLEAMPKGQKTYKRINHEMLMG